MGEVAMNVHFGGKMEFEPVVRYVGGDKRLVREEIDYVCWFELKYIIGSFGYDEPKRVWYKMPVLTLDDGLRPIFSDKEMLEMATIGIKHESIDVYVEADKKSCDLDGSSEKDTTHGIVTQGNTEAVVSEDAVKNDMIEANSVEDEVVHDKDHECEDINDDGMDFFPIEDTDGPEDDDSDSVFSSDNDDEEHIQACQNKKKMKSILRKEYCFNELGHSLKVAQESRTNVLSSIPTDIEGGIELSGKASEYYESDGDVSTPILSEDEELTFQVKRKKTKALVYNPQCDHRELKFELGMRFTDHKQFKEAVQKYVICNRVNIIWKRSSQKKMEARCQDGCKWKIYASWMQRELTFIVKTLGKDHSCNRSSRNRQASATWMAREYLHKFRANPNWSVAELERDLQEKYALTVSRWICYRAKWKALDMLRGSLYEHYQQLLSYIAELRKKHRLGTFELVTEAQSLISDHSDIVERVFKRLYIGFDELKQGFLQGCRPIIGLDGCFLKTFLGGQLLTAVARDGNNQMFPIAWAVVEGENKSSWSWFINILAEDLGTIHGHGYTIISDQQKGLVEAVHERMPLAEHRNCARHIYANWKKKNSGQILKVLFWRAVRSTTEADYRDTMTEMEAISSQAAEDFKKVGVAKFCKLYINTTCKCDSVDNNISETFNGYILKSRAKPIVEMLEEIRTCLMERMQEKKALMVNECEGSVCPRIKKKIDTLKWDSRLCIPRHAGNMTFQVEVLPNFVENPNQCFSYNRFVVDLNLHTCSCRKWQLSGIPCPHAICCINWLKEDVDKYVDDYYKKEKYLTTYAFLLKPLPGPRDWPIIEQGSLLPPPYKKMPGRPKKVRVREEGERSNNTTGTLRRHGLQMQCRMCKQYGHNKRTCPLKHSSGSTSNNPKSGEAKSATSQLLEVRNEGIPMVEASESQAFVQQPEIHPPNVGSSRGEATKAPVKRGRPRKSVNASSSSAPKKRGRPRKSGNVSSVFAPKRPENIIQKEMREARKGIGIYGSSTTGNMYIMMPGGTVCQPYPGRTLQTTLLDDGRSDSAAVPIVAPGPTYQPSTGSTSQSSSFNGSKRATSSFHDAIKKRLGVTSNARREEIDSTQRSIVIDHGDWE